MSSSADLSALRFPEWLFEQDYLVFLSFFGWMLLGLLALSKPSRDRQRQSSLWLWFGYFACAQAMADFVRTLSFSDPFFREFSIATPLEMLGLGCLVELSMRRLDRYRGKSFPPFAAMACALLGFAIEVSSLLYSLIVAFLVSAVACLWFASTLAGIARQKRRPELYAVLGGVLLLIPAWLLHPDHIAFARNEPLIAFSEYPFYGFSLLFLKILSVWVAIGGFWVFRMRDRLEGAGPHAGERLRFWGYRVLPSALGLIILGSYLATTWNGRRESQSMEAAFLSRSQMAALAIAEGASGEALARKASGLPSQKAELAAKLRSVQGVGTEAQRAYLWRESPGGIEALVADAGEAGSSALGAMAWGGEMRQELDRARPFVTGPVRVGDRLLINANTPILEESSGRVAMWLGLDIESEEWIKSVSLARLQAIIIGGLVMALGVFFFYYQIENESETDLALAKERAEAADRAKSEFLAVISHEIRTPLQSVLGYSNLLRGTRLDEKQLACLDTIQSEGKILLRIVQDILDFSNLRKASSALKESEVALKRLVEETYRTVRPMAERKGLAAELELDAGLPKSVLADGVRLRQVLLNLFGNSVKYTEHGKVKLAVRRRSGAGEGGLDFVISDTGVGIKEEDLGRLFEPFIQLEHVGSSPREGAGLGLAIVQRIVELMGGRISVESVYGKGSVFTASFDFKVLEEAGVDSEEEASVVEVGERSMAPLGERFPLKVLVADDNPMVRRLIVQYLEALGYSPDQVDDGIPAAEVGPAYDLIVTDLRMPGMSGPDAARIIREKSGLKEQPWIVGVSATLAESEIERALESGINDFMGKPFFESDLERRILSIPWLEELAGVGEDEESEMEVAPEGVDAPEMPAASFAEGGMGMFSNEMIEAALAEVLSLCEAMQEANLKGDFEFIREKAHYLSNTAMALGMETLYVDSKALQAAAEKELDAATVMLEKLQRNFEAWERSRTG